MADVAARSVYRAIFDSDYDEDVDLKGRTAAHALAEQMAGALTKDGLLAAPATAQQPEIPGPERDLLYEEAKTLGLGEAYLERRGETTWIRAARVVRAVHNHLPGRPPIGLREAKVLGEAIAVAFEDHAAARPAVDREALLDVLATADEDWRNQTEETDKLYLEHLADRLIAADAIAGTP